MEMKVTVWHLHRGHGLVISSAPRDPGIPPLMRLLIGLRYRVEGVLHEYLGSARLPDGSGIAHVFLRNEWRPDTPDQLPLTLVADGNVDESVSKTKMRRSGR